MVLDTRSNVAFGGAHIPGAFNVPLGPMLATWVGWLVPPRAPLVLVLERDDDWATVTTTLQRIGYEHCAGYLHHGMTSWQEQGLDVASVPQLDVHEVDRRRRQPGVEVLDVRMDSEWQEGHIAGAHHLPLGSNLPAHLGDLHLDPTRPLIVVCGSGYRSSIATSLLQQRGYQQVWNTLGGMTAWQEAGLPTVRPDETAARTGSDVKDVHLDDEGQRLLRREDASLPTPHR
ncbi:MAG: rhodanese-like domain-containing protein [Chloroflexota bacterium]